MDAEARSGGDDSTGQVAEEERRRAGRSVSMLLITTGDKTRQIREHHFRHTGLSHGDRISRGICKFVLATVYKPNERLEG